MKKGIALETVVTFIAGIVFLVLVIFVIATTGLFQAYMEQASVLFCTFSAYSRGALMEVVEALLPYIYAMIIIIVALSGGTLAYGAKFGGAAAGSLSAAGASLKATAQIFVAVMLAAVLSSAISNIPIFCSVNALSVESQPIDDFVGVIGSRSIDTFNTFGGGTLNPLWGLEPNPRTFYTVYVDLEEEVNMKEVLYLSYETFNHSWPFRDPLDEDSELKIHLYCPNYLGNDPEKWDSCKIENNYIYIMFLDKVPYDTLSPYGSDLCNMRLGTVRKDFSVTEDVVVWCVTNV